MTKEEIMEYLETNDWSEELLENISKAVANYSVYQEDPDTLRTYNIKYHLTYESAIEDYKSRNYVPTGNWCRCIMSKLHQKDDYIQEGIISLKDWD